LCGWIEIKQKRSFHEISHKFQIQTSEVEKHVYNEHKILKTFFIFTDAAYILRRSRRLCGRRQILIWILNVWEPWGHEACLFRAARQCMVDSFLGNGNVTMQQLCAAEFWFHPTEPCQEAGNPMPAAKNKIIWNFSLLLAKDWWREHAGLTNLADLFPSFPSDKVAHMRQIPCISGREIMNSFPCRMSFCLVRWKFRKTCPWWRAWGK
jgi:hypothetical protein